MGSGACHAVLSSPTWGHERKRSSATRDGRAAFRRFSRCGFHPQQRQRAASRPCRRRRQPRIAFQPSDLVGVLLCSESRRAPSSCLLVSLPPARSALLFCLSHVLSPFSFSHLFFLLLLFFFFFF